MMGLFVSFVFFRKYLLPFFA